MSAAGVGFGLTKTALHRLAVGMIEQRSPEPFSKQLFIEQHVVDIDVGQHASIFILPFAIELESNGLSFDESGSEFVRFGPPGLDGGSFTLRLGGVDAEQTHAAAVFKQQSVSVDGPFHDDG